MQENLFINYIDYFRNLQLKHKQLNNFVHGTTNRILTKVRSEIEYPCLWLETPSFKVSDNGAEEITAGHSGAFVVMTNVSVEEEGAQDLLWAEMLQITVDILARLKKESEESDLRIDFNSISMDPISTITADNDYGWRVEFSLVKELDICYDASKWND